MSRTVVVSQPMFLPWVGLFQQVHLADVFFHYDDVQLPQGRSFMSRVQVKTPAGSTWLTVPIDRKNSGKLINQVVVSRQEDWRRRHLATIRHAYSAAPHFDEMYDLVQRVYSLQTDYLVELNIFFVEEIARWLQLPADFRRTSATDIGGSSTARLVELCRAACATRYVTGLGALKYLEHEAFERHGIDVEYMDYQLPPYPQRFGAFTPYVSIIDGIANLGENVRTLISPKTVGWRTLV